MQQSSTRQNAKQTTSTSNNGKQTTSTYNNGKQTNSSAQHNNKGVETQNQHRASPGAGRPARRPKVPMENSRGNRVLKMKKTTKKRKSAKKTTKKRKSAKKTTKKRKSAKK